MEYAEKFKHLNCFYTLPLDEEWRCHKFENGLRGDIRLMVAPSRTLLHWWRRPGWWRRWRTR